MSDDAVHDLGTDLYLRPRDDRRFELGVVMGAQVKTGSSYFDSPVAASPDMPAGWWFSADAEHFDYWLNHALPHVIILRDQQSECSYWAHVTTDAVIRTGKNAKILVPATQLVNSSQNEALRAVALTQRPKPAWDGSAWTGAQNLAPTDEIRHALLTPRLIAPHPNLASTTISGIEALAMQVLLRTELDGILTAERCCAGRTAEVDSLNLTLDEAKRSPDFNWQAVAALHLWLFQNEAAHLNGLQSRASEPHEYAAATALLSAYHYEESDPDSCLNVATNALLNHEFSPVDHAWLRAHQARALLDLGRQEEAFDAAMTALGIQRQLPADATASAIGGACALIAFRAAGWMNGDLGATIELNDTAPSWWRTQVLAHGLGSQLDERFRSWTDEISFRYGLTDAASAERQLCTVALLASLAGDHSGWAYATRMRAQNFFVSASSDWEVDDVAAHLSMFRQSGDHNRTRLATERIVSTGPLEAVRNVAAETDPSWSTVTTAAADLGLLSAAGDLLDERQAAALCAWALQTLRDPTEYVTRTRQVEPTAQILRMLRSILPALPTASVRDLIRFVLSLPPVSESPHSTEVSHLVRGIPDHAWTEQDRQDAGTRAPADEPLTRDAFMAVAGPLAIGIQAEIRRRALEGDTSVFRALADLHNLPPDSLGSVADALCNQISLTIEAASAGSYAFGAPCPGKALSVLSIHHPRVARWNEIEALLRAPKVSPRHKEGTLAVLAARGNELPKDIRLRLFKVAAELYDQTPTGAWDSQDWLSSRAARCRAAEAAASLGPATHRMTLALELLSAGPAERVSAAWIFGQLGESSIPVLAALAGDANRAVQLEAIDAFGRLAALGIEDQVVQRVLEDALTRDGVEAAMAAAEHLPSSPTNAMVSELRAIGVQHRSARVRTRCATA